MYSNKKVVADALVGNERLKGLTDKAIEAQKKVNEIRKQHIAAEKELQALLGQVNNETEELWCNKH